MAKELQTDQKQYKLLKIKTHARPGNQTRFP